MTDKEAADLAAVQDKIAALPAFNAVAARLHEVIMAAGPDLRPRLWYGMPGYATAKKNPVVCFFRVDGEDYLTLGLSEHGHHEPDERRGDLLMESAWFLTDLDDATEARVTEIVTRAFR